MNIKKKIQYKQFIEDEEEEEEEESSDKEEFSSDYKPKYASYKLNENN